MYTIRSCLIKTATKRTPPFATDKNSAICKLYTSGKLMSNNFFAGAPSLKLSNEKDVGEHLHTDKGRITKLHDRLVSRKQLQEEEAKVRLSLKQNVEPGDTFGADFGSQEDNKSTGNDSVCRKIQTSGSVKSSSDTFGQIAAEADPAFRSQLNRNMDEDNLDSEMHRPLAPFRPNKVPWWYGKQIEKLGAQGKIIEAIAVLEEQMLVKDRVRPSEYCFTALIGALGRVGYTKKAFSLFNQMKQMGIIPSAATYTALFNACSNSPFKDGLPRATKLLTLMRQNGIQPNLTNYKVMIKVFGKDGDLITAFSLADELSQSYKPDGEVFSFLLMACISDKEAGLKHAVEVWRRLRKSKLPITTFHYNLLLRAVKECEFGDSQYMQTLVKSRPQVSNPTPILLESNMMPDSKVHPLEKLIERDSRDISDILETDDATPETSQPLEMGQSTATELTTTSHSTLNFKHISIMDADVPNILNPRAKFKSVVSLGEMRKASDRFLLLGGLPGFLRHMDSDEAHPDIKTFTQCLELIPNTRQAEQDLIMAADVYKVKLDTDFFNLLIRKVCKRRDFDTAKDVLEIMSSRHLQPNIMTFGCLALGCFLKQDGLALLEDMKQAGFTPNLPIYNTLSWRSENDYYYKIEILKSMKTMDVQPNKKFLQHMEKALQTGKQHLSDLEHYRGVPDYVHSRHYQKGFKHFRLFYSQWLSWMGVQEEEHPWTHFRKTLT